jgi:hydrogenase nickel incorporation protein HypB
MCKDCGCGIVGEVSIDGKPGSRVPSPLDHAHDHDHDHPHEHEPGHESPAHTLAVHRAILDKNDRVAERNRGFFKAKGLLVLNLVSSPGSGKTTLVQKTAEALQGRLRTGVIVGDLATDNDAARLRAAGVPVVQITTGTVCHLEADMVTKAMGQLDLNALDLLVIENVGNLVCPATYDLGEDLRVVLLSVTEEDKPLKYPPMFHSAQVAILNKIDLADACDFDREMALTNLHRVSHHATTFELSARTGAGMEAWCDFLVQRHRALRV